MKKLFIALCLIAQVASANQLPVRPIWHAHAGASHRFQDLQLTPTLSRNQIITTDSKGIIYSNNRKTGRRLWTLKTKMGLNTGVAISREAMVVATNDAKIIAYHPKSHKQLWMNTIASEALAKPVIHKNIVLVKTIDGQLSAFNSKTGKLIWRYQHPKSNEILLHTSSSPVVSNEKVIVGFNDGNLLALSLQGGLVIWSTAIAGDTGFSQMDQVVDVTATPIISGNEIFVASYQGNIKSLDIRTGNVNWSHKFSTYRPLSIDNQHIYAVDDEGQVWSFDRKNGKVAWRQPHFKGHKLSAPASHKKYVVVGDDHGYLHWFKKSNGRLISSYRTNQAAITAAPLVADNSIYSVSAGGELIKFQIAQK